MGWLRTLTSGHVGGPGSALPTCSCWISRDDRSRHIDEAASPEFIGGCGAAVSVDGVLDGNLGLGTAAPPRVKVLANQVK